MTDGALLEFLAGSNHIEGVEGVAGREAILARLVLEHEGPVELGALQEYVFATAGSHAELRQLKGMNVIVGNHRPPDGGPTIVSDLLAILSDAHDRIGHSEAPYRIHQAFETLHPFMDGNSRSGRLLWLWMHSRAGTYMGLGFLHQWYYESLRIWRE